jgi:hypothetical protein
LKRDQAAGSNGNGASHGPFVNIVELDNTVPGGFRYKQGPATAKVL